MTPYEIAHMHVSLMELSAGRDRMQAEIADLKAERDALRAKLAELASQEPVIWQSWHDSYGYGYWDTLKEAELNSAGDFEPVPLYAAPGAKQ